MLIRLVAKGLFSLARLSDGEIKEIIVRWTGGGYFQLDPNSHIIINGDGKAFTNNFSLMDTKYDPCYKRGAVLVSLLAGYGAKEGGEGQKIDFGLCPPNEKQLNSLAHVLAIMCLGLRLGVDCIKTLAELGKDSINLAVYPNEAGSGGEVIRGRTQKVLEDMKKGLYKSINPALVGKPVWTGDMDEGSGFSGDRYESYQLW